MPTLMLLALLAGTDGSSCEPDDLGFCTAKNVLLQLRKAEPYINVKLNTALGTVTTLHFPEGIQVTEEDVVIGNTPVFGVTLSARKLAIHASVPAEAAQKASRAGANVGQLLQNSRGNIQIALKRGWQINLDVRLWYPSLSVRSVTFASDDISADERYIATQLEAERQAIHAEYEARNASLDDEVREKALAQVAQDVLARNTCRDGGGVQMHDLLWVAHDKACLVGESVHLHFTLRNRSRGVEFRVGSVELFDDADAPLEALVVFRSEEGKPLTAAGVRLKMNDEVLGAAVFAPDVVEGNVALVIREAGGGNRTVRLEGIAF